MPPTQPAPEGQPPVAQPDIAVAPAVQPEVVASQPEAEEALPVGAQDPELTLEAPDAAVPTEPTPEAAPQPASAEQVDALAAEVEELRAEVRQMREMQVATPVETATPPAPEPAAVAPGIVRRGEAPAGDVFAAASASAADEARSHNEDLAAAQATANLHIPDGINADDVPVAPAAEAAPTPEPAPEMIRVPVPPAAPEATPGDQDNV